MHYSINEIGTFSCKEGHYQITLKPAYRAALVGLEGFSHIQVLWWFSGCDNTQSRSTLVQHRPYSKGPALLGTFATRAPERPNPIAVSPAEVIYVDSENGVIGLAWVDADDGTPVLDIKAYMPSVDRVEKPGVPAWCAHWPKSVEASGNFDWEKEFNF